MPTFSDLMRWRFSEKDHTNLPRDTKVFHFFKQKKSFNLFFHFLTPYAKKVLDENLPVHFLTDKEIETFCNTDTSNKTLVIWIGHATSLVNFQNQIILMDPVFSERCSPVRFAGPKRFRPVPISVERIPRVDHVIISHNHYDHLDYQSVLDLNKKVDKNSIKKKVNWWVGKGGGQWFRDLGIESDHVHELTWWESKKLNNLEFVFTPAQHWCRRRMTDINEVNFYLNFL
jgi:N-acyl-phosphatidylethanolamine-hydrolysing phospholipase D